MSTLKVHVPPVPGRYQPATRRPRQCHDLRMRLRPLVLATLLLALSAVPAEAASRLTVRGAGFGHGVGMSQYGALGFAQHGATYRDIVAHYFTGTQISKLDAPSQVRVLLQSGGSVKVRGVASVVGSRALTPSATYTAVSGGPRRRGAALGEGERHRPLPGAAAARRRRGRVHAAGPRPERRPRRRLPGRARGEPCAVRAHGRQRAGPRELHPGRRARGDPRARGRPRRSRRRRWRRGPTRSRRASP